MLAISAFEDWCPNGLQVEGRAEVRVVVSGVSAHVALFERARELRADLVLAHHGIFWQGDELRVVGAHRTRLALLLESGISLAAYHLPLDAHPQLGNNALLACGLGCDERQRFAAIGCGASFPGDGIEAAELRRRVAQLTEREPLMFDNGASRIRRLAILSGAGSSSLGEAIAEGYDAFLTGEPAERVMAQASEAGIHFIAAGHHATERLGVQALGEHVAARFGVAHHFVDVPNPI